MSDNLLFVQSQPFSLAGAGGNIGDSTVVLTSMKDINGVLLTMADFGTIAYATIEPGNGIQEEQISFSGITQNSNGTATLTGVKTVLMKAPYTQTANLGKTHAGGTQLVISNTAGFYDSMTSKSNDETITGLYTFTQTPIIPVAAPTLDTQVANKKYVDDTAIAGSPNMTTSTKGIAQEATDTQINAGTQTGTTGAELAVNPKYLKDSQYYTLRPTADQKDALAGTGTPSAANKYVTADTDALKELLANKDATTTLGTSDTKYPTQKAVKTYVDAYSPTTTNGIITRALDAASGTVNTAHGLGRIPKKVRITAVYQGLNVNNCHSHGVYNGTTMSCDYIVEGGAGVNGVNEAGQSSSFVVNCKRRTSSTDYPYSATITVDATNIMLAWTRDANYGAGTAYLMWEAQ